MQINVNEIEKVYSGRAGCMCGCRGKWTYATESTRSVAIISGKLARNPNTTYDEKASCYFIKENGRILAAYKKGA